MSTKKTNEEKKKPTTEVKVKDLTPKKTVKGGLFRNI
jgi:hypothetical protein